MPEPPDEEPIKVNEGPEPVPEPPTADDAGAIGAESELMKDAKTNVGREPEPPPEPAPEKRINSGPVKKND